MDCLLALGAGGYGAAVVVDSELLRLVEIIYANLRYRGDLVVKLSYHSDQSPSLLVSQLREYDLMNRFSQVRHPNLTPLVGVVRLQETVTVEYPPNVRRSLAGLGLVLPRARSLDTLELPTLTKLTYYAQALTGLEYLHAHGYVHRDFKLDNILVAEPEAWLADFGATCLLKQAHLEQALVGAECYAAPELRVDPPRYSLASDIWSAALALLVLFSAERPTGTAIEALDIPAPTAELGSAVTELLAGMLAPRPQARWTITQVLDHSVFDPVRSMLQRSHASLPPVEPYYYPHPHLEWRWLRSWLRADYQAQPRSALIDEVFGQTIALLDRVLVKRPSMERTELRVCYQTCLELMTQYYCPLDDPLLLELRPRYDDQIALAQQLSLSIVSQFTRGTLVVDLQHNLARQWLSEA